MIAALGQRAFPLPACGHGGDLPGLTDTQWYMFHQQNVAHFAAFSATAFAEADRLRLAKALLARAPQLSAGFDGLTDAQLIGAVSRQDVEALSAYPEQGLNADDDLLTNPDLPLFRMRLVTRKGGPDEKGRAGYVQVRVSHALVEGMDSALLSRSRSANHAYRTPPPPTPRAPLAGFVGGLAAIGHLIVGNLHSPHPGGFAHRTEVLDRREIGALARWLGVRQRALLFALVLNTLFGQGTAKGKATVSSTYSTIDDKAVTRDGFMRMRMLFAKFRNAEDLAAFVRAVDARLAQTETRESGFSAAMDAGAIAAHRRLAPILKAAYRPKLFRFMPFDLIVGLIPPHRLDGELAQTLIEPVFAGAATPGGNACVIVPNRDVFTFNFYLQTKLLPLTARLAPALAAFAAASPQDRKAST